MFGTYVSTKELITLYFAITSLLLVLNLIVSIFAVLKTNKINNKISLNATAVSGKENEIDRC